MEKSYDPQRIESSWREFWEQSGHYAPSGDGEPYSIVIPPPNVTGTLHMGHAFQHTVMDALIRYQRMRGRRCLWQPGTDHAGIATQMVVERNLKLAGEPSRAELCREKFVDKVWEWKRYSGGTIEAQIRRMGSSVDWSRNAFTMDPSYSTAVVEHFVQLHEQGLIYRGKRLVNWDPVLLTAISDLEVVSEEENGKLWHFRYPLSDGSGHLVVATTRPETMLGDTAVAVHPDDERYQHLIGKSIRLPLAEREIPILADEFVERAFGTGCVKITPAHDFNDYAVGQRHGLEMINILTPEAKINDQAPASYQGMDRFEARKQVVADLDALGLLEKIEDHKLKVPRGDRSGVVVEPYLTDQWFVDLTRENRHDGQPGPGGKAAITDPAIDAVEKGLVQFVPENWSNTYFHWLRNIQDWCISRQLWWGHRIPAWYDNDGNVFVGRNEAEVREKHGISADTPLRQDEDVFDTWFSSDIWPMATLEWPQDSQALRQFYPTSVLVTGFDIIFFWVARMVMMGLYFMDGAPPFKEVYITGLVRDPEGNKMSKSKGNVLDPLDVVDGISLDDLIAKRTTGLMNPKAAPKIEKKTRKDYPNGIEAVGVDALRFTFAALATNGRDIRFDASRAAGYRNFCNKIWNAARYVLMNCEQQDCGASGGDEVTLSSADRWIISRLQRLEKEAEEHFAGYRFDLLAQALYQFIWNEYCDWYLELSKPALQIGTPAQQRGTRRTLIRVLETALRLLHPIMPFVTEEVWQRIAPLAGVNGDTIMTQAYPQADDSKIDEDAEREIEWLKALILGVRQIRGEMDLSPAKTLPLLIQGPGAEDQALLQRLQQSICFLAKVEAPRILKDAETAPQSAAALLGDMQLLVPMAGLIDKDAELARLSKRMNKLESDMAKTKARVENPNFGKAPPHVQAQARTLHEKQQQEHGTLRTQIENIKLL
ncbi:MAG: valine--tRNA ligase [Panacagrimonas sp.]